VTVLIDHDGVDGMPAARFVADAVRGRRATAGGVGGRVRVGRLSLEDDQLRI